MTSDKRSLCGNGPVALGSVQVGVADTGAVELDETLAGLEVLWLGDGDVTNLEGCVLRGDDGGPHGLGDGVLGRHGAV